MNPSNSTPNRSSPDWHALGVATLRVTLGISGTVLNTTGRVLLACGRHALALRTRLRPQ